MRMKLIDEAIVKEAKRYKNEYNLKKPLAEHIN